ncbi:MAG TPA: APC family permease [Vicinamibacterales bacterium]|nr:APC family permease [Vicinamibacterales bacterium]
MTTPVVPALPEGQAAGLRRELGRWDLTAFGVNQVIGGGVFALPSVLAAIVGAWSLAVILAVGLGSMLIALSFAEVASRFERTGGSYLYARAAFGRLAAFEVGWLLWFTRTASWASVMHVLVMSLGFYWPALTAGIPRFATMTAIVLVVTAINLRGIRESSLAVNALTVGKLTPLLVFIAAGLFFAEPGRLAPGTAPSLAEWSATGLLMIFAFGGYETLPIVAGEARNPRRGVPFALVATIAVVTVVYALIQAVALGTLPGLASSRTPLADASLAFLGAGGAALMTLGAVISTSGNNLGGAISGSRILFAMAEQGDLPRFMARVHARYRTPVTAILVTSAVTYLLALSGTFSALAEASAISRLVTYLVTCAAALRLRHARFAGLVEPATFTVPFGPAIPLAAIGIGLAILAGATRTQLTAGALGLLAGALLYLALADRNTEGGERSWS